MKKREKTQISNIRMKRVNTMTNEFENRWTGQFSGKIKISKLTGKGENLNRPVTVSEIQSVIGCFSLERHSTSPVIREMHVKVAAWCHFTAPASRQRRKCPMVPRVGKDMAESSTCTPWMGVQFGTIALEQGWSYSFPTDLQVWVSALEKPFPDAQEDTPYTLFT